MKSKELELVLTTMVYELKRLKHEIQMDPQIQAIQLTMALSFVINAINKAMQTADNEE